MHVPVDDRHPFGAIGFLRMPRGDRRLVEQAEPHGGVLLGMVAGRSGCHKGIVGFLAEHCIHRRHCATDRDQCRFHRARACRGVGIDPRESGFRYGSADLRKVAFRMCQKHRFGCSLGREVPHQRVEMLVFEDSLERFHPVGPLGMARRHQMFETDGIGIVKRGHPLHLAMKSARCQRAGTQEFKVTPQSASRPQSP
jgi:hypothetical protein